MPATNRRAFASAAPDPVLPETLDVSGRARRTYDGILASDERAKRRALRGPLRHRLYHGTREDNTSSALHRVGEELTHLRNAGFPEATLRHAEQYVHDLIDALYPAVALRSVDELDLLEQRVESRESGLSIRARIEQTPDAFRAAAQAKREEIAVETETARAYDLTAARLEREQLRPPTIWPAA